MENVNCFKAGVTAVFAAMTALWGWFGWLLLLWIGCMILDYFTGFGTAVKNGEWKSSTAREGIWHKVGCGYYGRKDRIGHKYTPSQGVKSRAGGE